MSEIIKQTLAELRSIGNVIHGPEVWLAFPLILLANFVIGFLIFGNWEDDDK